MTTSFITAFLATVINMLPYRIISYYPFRNQLRFPAWVVALIIGGSQILQSTLTTVLYVSGKPTRSPELWLGLMCFAIYLLCIRADGFKCLFLYIFVTDYIMIIRGLSYFAMSYLFKNPDFSVGNLNTAVVTLIFFFLSAPFMIRFLSRTKERVFLTDSPQLWRVIWVLPAFTTIIVLMFTSDFSSDNVRKPRFFIARVLLILGVFIIYYVLLQSLENIRKQTILEEQAAQQELMLSLQRSQYEQLTRHMDTTRQARHDLRQHLRVISSLVEQKNWEELRSYLGEYQQSLPSDTMETWCSNYAVNTLLCYYKEEARKACIRFSVKTELPCELPISEPMFCSIIGNLLENALTACLHQADGNAYIELGAKLFPDQILLFVDNSCSRPPVQQDGRFLSSTHKGYGIGTASIKNTVSLCNGTVDFQYKNNVFYTSITLPLHNPTH